MSSVNNNLYIDNLNVNNLEEVSEQVKTAAADKVNVVINNIDPKLEKVLSYIPSLSVPEKTEIKAEDLKKVLDTLNNLSEVLGTNSKSAAALGSSNTASTSNDSNEIFGGIGNIATQLAALIVKTAAQQRESNREEIAANSEALVANIHEQADDLRKQAIAQLASSIVSGVFSIAQGGLSIAGGAKSLSINKTASLASEVANSSSDAFVKATHQSFAQELNTKASSLNEIFSGMGSLAKGLGDVSSGVANYFATEASADMKNKEAEQASINGTIERYKQLNDSLKELISGVIQATEKIVDDSNKAISKIVG